LDQSAFQGLPHLLQFWHLLLHLLLPLQRLLLLLHLLF
jgi:hypothetical protein